MNEFQEAGVGMIYLPGLENMIESQFHLLDVIEIEPQTLWYNKDSNCDSFNFNMDQSKILEAYPCHKLFHSVGFPIGGTIHPNVADFQLLNDHIRFINPLWISEHLSFNKFEIDGRIIDTNFLLPPCQTAEGVDVAVNAIKHFQSNVPLPFALETGVNYLKPNCWEMPDGQFVCEIASKANCYILLDLHNIMANQINGRQKVDEFITQLPMERIYEIHIAGGFFHNGYYLDGHSGVSSIELFDMLEKLVRKLPHLKALIFEMLPDYIKEVSNEEMFKQLEKMHRIWDRKGNEFRIPLRKSTLREESKTSKQNVSVKEWENTLGKAAIEKDISETELSLTLAVDKGVQIINELIFHFRASMLISTLRLSTRLLKLSLGAEKFNENIKTFFSSSEPDMFAFAAAKKYADYIDDLNLGIPYLHKLVVYELASLQTLADHQARCIDFDFNPFAVFRSLEQSELPEAQDAKMNFVLDIQPDSAESNLDSFNYYSVFHN